MFYAIINTFVYPDDQNNNNNNNNNNDDDDDDDDNDVDDEDDKKERNNFITRIIKYSSISFKTVKHIFIILV